VKAPARQLRKEGAFVHGQQLLRPCGGCRPHHGARAIVQWQKRQRAGRREALVGPAGVDHLRCDVGDYRKLRVILDCSGDTRGRADL
jgi:hypothetical protein